MRFVWIFVTGLFLFELSDLKNAKAEDGFSKTSVFSSAYLPSEQEVKDRIQRVLLKTDEYLEKQNVDLLVGIRFKLAALSKPLLVSTLVGDGFFSSCHDKMSPQARNNYLKTMIVGSEVDAPQKVAMEVRHSLRDATSISEEQAQEKVCHLASAPCYLYSPSGPVALNCVTED